jgi:putative ABC transport system ATP-binding protein
MSMSTDARHPLSPNTSADTAGLEGTTPTAVRAEGLVKIYGRGDTAVRALNGADLTLRRGSLTAVMGPSGSGKSTLMHCLAGLDTATGGRVLLGGTDPSQLGDRELTEIRRDRSGFIFQSFNLLPTLTAEQNILLPLDLAGRTPTGSTSRR